MESGKELHFFKVSSQRAQYSNCGMKIKAKSHYPKTSENNSHSPYNTVLPKVSRKSYHPQAAFVTHIKISCQIILSKKCFLNRIYELKTNN